MKKTISTMICLGAMLLALTACSDDTETRLAAVPTVALSPSSITLSAEAVESYTINYTVSSPGEGASVSASADVSWISGVDASVSGQVRLSVAANASDEMRTGTVTLTYSYDGGAVTAKAAVVQYGAGGPVLTVDPNAVVASHEGGPYSFGYSIENPLDGESVSCTADADWVSGFDYSTYGTVSFTVVESEEEGLRTATITVSYASLSKEVTVVQDHPGSGDDSGSGGGGDGSLVGTYSCSGTVYNEDYNPYVSGSSPFAEATWTMKIYDHGDGQLLLSGLVPDTVDYYPYDTGDGNTHDNGPYTAYATVSGNNIRVSYPQWTGWSTTLSDNSKVYICWVCCPATTGDSGEGWYYNTSSGTCTFTYDSAAGSWTSNVGLFLGLCSSDSSLTSNTFYSYYDVFAPGMTFTKTSNSTSTGAAPSSLKSLTERPTHTGAKVSSAPASGTVSVTRSLGPVRQGDAKLAK